jgi:HprK-related kinase A
MQRLAGLGAQEAQRLLKLGQLRLRTGPFTVAVQTELPEVQHSLLTLYGEHPLAPADGFVDFSVRVRRPGGLRRWWQPQVAFELDGQSPFNPLPGDQGFPLLEWGLNWCVYGTCHQYLVIHAAVLERGGRALLLPAPSGSGKSTLCAGLCFSGWRLLSDELALLDPATGQVWPLPRPVSLKNQSIEVIAAFAPQARFGSRVSETNKGTVAHFAPPVEAVRRAAEPALPAWIVLPRYEAGTAARFERQERAMATMALIDNAFNYSLFGSEGFDLLTGMASRCECYEFTYSDLHEAAAQFALLADGQDMDPP